jgi:hypothetical protein
LSAYAIFSPTPSSCWWTPLGRGSDGRFGSAGFAPNRNQERLALTALSLAPCHPPEASVLPFAPFRLFLSANAVSEEQKQPDTARKGKNNAFSLGVHPWSLVYRARNLREGKDTISERLNVRVRSDLLEN